jgi:hypothetical protein
VEKLSGVGRSGPAWTAVAVAGVLAEERSDSVWAEVGHAVLASLGQDHGIGQDDLVLVDAALQVAEDVVAAGDVVAEVCLGVLVMACEV